MWSDAGLLANINVGICQQSCLHICISNIFVCYRKFFRGYSQFYNRPLAHNPNDQGFIHSSASSSIKAFGRIVMPLIIGFSKCVRIIPHSSMLWQLQIFPQKWPFIILNIFLNEQRNSTRLTSEEVNQFIESMTYSGGKYIVFWGGLQ